MQNNKILEVNKLNKYFNKSGKLVKILDNVTFDVYEKDFLGIIGESGSGKSTTGKCIIRLYSSSSGSIFFEDKIINQKKISRETKRWLYKNMSMIFQDPMSSLNPRKNVLSLISEPLIINKTIANEASEIIANCKEINHFFVNTYKVQDYDITKELLVDYYNVNIELFDRLIDEITDAPARFDNLVTYRNILVDMENNYKASLHAYSEYVRLIKLLYKYNLNRYQLDQLDDTEVKYRSKLNEKKIKKSLMKGPVKYWDVRSFTEKLQADLKEFLKQNKLIYNEQNYNRIRSIKTKYNSEIKSLKQNAHLTTSITENIYNKVSILILKDTLKAIKEIDRDIYVSQHEIEIFSNFINEQITKKYHPLIELINELGILSESIDKLLEDNNQYHEEELRAKLAQYSDLYNNVKRELKEYKKQDPLDENEDVKKAIYILKNTSKQKEAKLHYEKIIQKEKIDELKDDYKKIRADFIKNYNDEEAKAYYDQAKREYIVAKMNRREKAIQANDYFNEQYLPLIEELEMQLKGLEADLKNKQKIFKELVKAKLDKIKKQIDKKNKNLMNEYKILANELLVKLESISAINFEIETYNDDLRLYRNLRSTSSFKVSRNYRALKQSLIRDYVYEALNEVGLKTEHAYRYPHEFSGGQRQRIVIARALISKPKLVIADEPISALDVSIQAQVINIMRSLAEKYGITFLFIAHDLSMVKYTCNRLIILHKGRIVEKGNTDEVFSNPIHPYTKSLIKASPELSKIHINLASFSTKLDYDKDYSPNNVPEFFKVPNEKEHYVFATKEQFKEWMKK